MGEVTLTVPAKYADDFRAALAHELGDEAGYVKKERKEFLEAQAMEREDAHKGDLVGAMRMLTRDAQMFIQAGFEGDGDIEISMEDDVGAVAFACETVARNIVGPQLADALDCGPFDSNYAPKLRDLIDRMTWAIDRAAEVNEAYFSGHRLGRLSEASEMTPSEVAAAIDVDPALVEGWRRGEAIPAEHRSALAKLFAVKESFLMGEA